MTETPPTIYLLYGDHQLAFSEFIALLRERMGDPISADMNIDTFSPDKHDLGKLEQVCKSMPFLTRRRLVIAEQPTRFFSSDDSKEKFFNLLSSMPETTALLLIETVDLKTAKGKLPTNLTHLIQWLEENQPSTFIRSYEIPHGSQFVQWIRQRAVDLDGEIEPQAAHLLAEYVNEDPHLTQQELIKLLDYVNRDRPIEVEDVEDLTPFQRQQDVFAMVDAIGHRNGSQALQWLRQLLEEDSRYAFNMIVRQFRLLLLAKDAQENQLDPKQVLKIHPYAAGKIITQARNFSLADLETIYHHLKEMDVASKTGQDVLEVSLERFVVELTQ